jgi:chromosomal replication initiation ATPase DnaA
VAEVKPAPPKTAPPKPGTQLALDLPVAPRLSAEDFLVGPSNEAAYALIEAWPDWPDSVLVLIGPEGSGKSHLAAIWSGRAGALRTEAEAITAARVPELAATSALLIEDADCGRLDEAALFHLLNLVRARSGAVTITARHAPDAWGLVTPDLLSRLRLAPSARIQPPDEALLKSVLVKHFVDRQLIVDTGVIDAIALRIPRAFAAARAVVEAIDRAALERGRRVTRALGAEFAEAIAAETEER